MAIIGLLLLYTELLIAHYKRLLGSDVKIICVLVIVLKLDIKVLKLYDTNYVCFVLIL